jgi:hypothetical protein
MAVNTAPLLSFSARGQIAKTQVYASWKGRPYTRRYTIPANPRSTDQQITRNCFSWLNNLWRLVSSDGQAPWTAFALGKVLTNRNAWISHNLPVLRGNADLTGIVLSPGAKGGIAVTPAVTPGSGSLACTLTAPSTLPSGWSIVSAVFMVVPQQSPESGTSFITQTATVAEPGPYTHTFSSLGSSTHWMVGGWFVYQRSSLASDLAYGPSTGVAYTTT